MGLVAHPVTHENMPMTASFGTARVSKRAEQRNGGRSCPLPHGRGSEPGYFRSSSSYALAHPVTHENRFDIEGLRSKVQGLYFRSSF